MEVDSDPVSAATLTHGDTLTMVVTLENTSASTAGGIRLLLTGSAGVNFQSVAGATCSDCTEADNWSLNVADLAIESAATVTVTAQLDSDLTGLETVATTIWLLSANSDNAVEVVIHPLDLTPPTVKILRAPGGVISSGQDSVAGLADDAGLDLLVAELLASPLADYEPADGPEEGRPRRPAPWAALFATLVGAAIVIAGQATGAFRAGPEPLLVAKAIFGILDEMATDWILSHRNRRLQPVLPHRRRRFHHDR